MKTGIRAKVVAAGLLAGLAGMVVAGAAGFARTFVLPADGVLSVVNAQENAVWRPCLVTVVCPDVAARTVTVSRVAGDLEYPVAECAGMARTFVYEFGANYWSGVSNGFKVAVSPACTGVVEVVYE